MTTKAADFIERDLLEQLRDRNFRKSFFLADASAKIAAQIIRLRKRRGKSQSDVAEMIGTRQSAISRVEKADYQNWSFNTLRSIADALDARIRVTIEPAEDILSEYDSSATESLHINGAALKAAQSQLQVDNERQTENQITSIFESNVLNGVRGTRVTQ